jgi:hypothetical protein
MIRSILRQLRGHLGYNLFEAIVHRLNPDVDNHYKIFGTFKYQPRVDAVEQEISRGRQVI